MMSNNARDARPMPSASAVPVFIETRDGLLTHVWQLGVLMLAVILLTAQAFVINRLAGIPYPTWRPITSPTPNTRFRSPA